MLPLKVELTLSPKYQQDFVLEVEGFLADCQMRNLALRTLAIYRHQLEAFGTWTHYHPATNTTTQEMRLYFLHLQQTHNAGGQHQAFRVLKTFYRWLVAEGVLAESPMARLKAPQLRDEPLTPVPLSDVVAMLATCTSKDLLDLRDAALLLVLLDTAARASELLQCNIGDFDMKSGALILRITKNRHQRVTFCGIRARKALLRYLRARDESEHTTPLFTTDDGQRLKPSGLRQILRRRALAAGVPIPSAHAFRRAACLALLRNGADVFTVQKLAGHADLATTRRYLKLATEDLQRVHAAHSPVDRLL